MEARAVARYIRISPLKTRQVANLIRGKRVDEALGILALTPRKSSPILRKVVLSASANVRNREDTDKPTTDAHLFIKEILVNEGPTLKRIRPRAQGRAYRILKRTSHIEVTVSSEA